MQNLAKKVLYKIRQERGRIDEEDLKNISSWLSCPLDSLKELANLMDDKSGLKLKFWLENEQGSTIFGRGSIEFLALIDELGSISAAAKLLGLSYKKVWSQICELERELGRELFIRKKGAGKQGGTRLKEEARELLRSAQAFDEELQGFAQMRFKELLGDFFKDLA